MNFIQYLKNWSKKKNKNVVAEDPLLEAFPKSRKSMPKITRYIT
jgi:hypothetical protein